MRVFLFGTIKILPYRLCGAHHSERWRLHTIACYFFLICYTGWTYFMIRFLYSMKSYIIFGLMLLGLAPLSLQAASGESWEDMLDIDIVTRAERGADEAWRQASSFGTSTTPAVSYQTEQAYNNLVQYFSEELVLDKVLTQDSEVNTGDLHWPLEYRRDKKAIVIHHTASSRENIEKAGNMITHVQNLYKTHTFSRGWGDIGYHFLIDENGVIYEGRAGGPDVIGAHTLRNNNATIGISLIGNFQIEQPTQAMIDAMTRLTQLVAAYYDIDPYEHVFFHKASSQDPFIEHVYEPSIV
jgi:hypothetical protein